MGEQEDTFYSAVKEGFPEEMAFVKRPEWNEKIHRFKQDNFWQKITSKGPDIGKLLYGRRAPKRM